MSIPTLPTFFDMYYTNPKDGRLTADGYLYNDQMFQVLNTALTLLNSIVNSNTTNNQTINNGLTPPPFTSAQIAALEPTVPNGTLWFNTDISKWQGKTAPGVIETITST